MDGPQQHPEKIRKFLEFSTAGGGSIFDFLFVMLANVVLHILTFVSYHDQCESSYGAVMRNAPSSAISLVILRDFYLFQNEVSRISPSGRNDESTE